MVQIFKKQEVYWLLFGKPYDIWPSKLVCFLMTTYTTCVPNFVKIWEGHYETLVEVIWNDPYIYLYHDGATLQSELPWYITDTLPRVAYFTLMFDMLVVNTIQSTRISKSIESKVKTIAEKMRNHVKQGHWINKCKKKHYWTEISIISTKEETISVLADWATTPSESRHLNKFSRVTWNVVKVGSSLLKVWIAWV